MTGYIFWATLALAAIILLGLAASELLVPEIVAPFNDVTEALERGR